MTNYPKGSMGAADQKTYFWFCLGATIAFVILMFLTFTPASQLYYHMKAAGAGFNVVGFLLGAFGIGMLWYGAKNDSKALVGIIGFILAFGCVMVICGFQFTDFNLPNHGK